MASKRAYDSVIHIVADNFDKNEFAEKEYNSIMKSITKMKKKAKNISKTVYDMSPVEKISHHVNFPSEAEKIKNEYEKILNSTGRVILEDKKKVLRIINENCFPGFIIDWKRTNSSMINDIELIFTNASGIDITFDEFYKEMRDERMNNIKDEIKRVKLPKLEKDMKDNEIDLRMSILQLSREYVTRKKPVYEFIDLSED